MKPTGKLAYAYKTISELEAQLAALKEENERLKDELAERQKYILSLEARVEELHRKNRELEEQNLKLRAELFYFKGQTQLAAELERGDL